MKHRMHNDNMIRTTIIHDYQNYDPIAAFWGAYLSTVDYPHMITTYSFQLGNPSLHPFRNPSDTNTSHNNNNNIRQARGRSCQTSRTTARQFAHSSATVPGQSTGAWVEGSFESCPQLPRIRQITTACKQRQTSDKRIALIRAFIRHVRQPCAGRVRLCAVTRKSGGGGPVYSWEA